MTKTNDVLSSIHRQLTMPQTDGPKATGFPAELLADLDEGRKRRLSRQREFDAYARADLGYLWPYSVIPHVSERTRETEVVIKLAGFAEIRRYYVSGGVGWMVGSWPFAGSGWAVLPHPDARPETWDYAGDLPDVLALADSMGPAYHRWKPPVDLPKAPTWQERLAQALADGVSDMRFGPGIMPIT